MLSQASDLEIFPTESICVVLHPNLEECFGFRIGCERNGRCMARVSEMRFANLTWQ